MDDLTKDPFEEYLRESEPDKRSKGYAWYTAIGLQDVDGLNTLPSIASCSRVFIRMQGNFVITTSPRKNGF